MSNDAESVAKRLRVHGKVQGVGYRAWCADIGTALGIDGWVRNRRDGTVEVLAVGAAGPIERLIEALHRGPPLAIVTDLAIEAADGVTPAGFQVKSTV